MLINNGLLKEQKEKMENVQISNDYFNRLRVIEIMIFYFGWIGIFSCILEYELRYDILTKRGYLSTY